MGNASGGEREWERGRLKGKVTFEGETLNSSQAKMRGW